MINAKGYNEHEEYYWSYENSQPFVPKHELESNYTREKHVNNKFR